MKTTTIDHVNGDQVPDSTHDRVVTWTDIQDQRDKWQSTLDKLQVEYTQVTQRLVQMEQQIHQLRGAIAGVDTLLVNAGVETR
jgi:septal ring factor EnvC (AmiA/AmiB activator)